MRTRFDKGFELVTDLAILATIAFLIGYLAAWIAHKLF